jgi:Protein of unknown function (DUF2716)
LSEDEESMVWDVVYDGFRFQPSTAFSMWPGFDEPSPSVTFRRPDHWTDIEIDDLYVVMRKHLSTAVRSGEWLYALDWQHECFVYDPTKLDEWDVKMAFQGGLFPDGDYAITLSSDARFGTLGHPWEGTICVFGDELVRFVLEHRPIMFREIVRSRGIDDGLLALLTPEV